jgi:hypothetical protein
VPISSVLCNSHSTQLDIVLQYDHQIKVYVVNLTLLVTIEHFLDYLVSRYHGRRSWLPTGLEIDYPCRPYKPDLKVNKIPRPFPIEIEGGIINFWINQVPCMHAPLTYNLGIDFSIR